MISRLNGYLYWNIRRFSEVEWITWNRSYRLKINEIDRILKFVLRWQIYLYCVFDIIIVNVWTHALKTIENHIWIVTEPTLPYIILVQTETAEILIKTYNGSPTYSREKIKILCYFVLSTNDTYYFTSQLYCIGDNLRTKTNLNKNQYDMTRINKLFNTIGRWFRWLTIKWHTIYPNMTWMISQLYWQWHSHIHVFHKGIFCHSYCRATKNKTI